MVAEVDGSLETVIFGFLGLWIDRLYQDKHWSHFLEVAFSTDSEEEHWLRYSSCLVVVRRSGAL